MSVKIKVQQKIKCNAAMGYKPRRESLFILSIMLTSLVWLSW